MRSLRCAIGIVLAIALVCWFPALSIGNGAPVAGQGNGYAWAASSTAIRVADELSEQEKDFSGQSILEKEFIRARLENANFSGADLRGTVFSGTALTGANFHGADLSDVIMYTTDLTNADLTDANLTAVMLLQTRLDGADITGADFSYSTIDRNQLIKLCGRASGVNSVTGVDTRESLECK
ncbi:MAG: pentapeptide repeat-containing protein [Cyanobacteria bacterium J06633_2]